MRVDCYFKQNVKIATRDKRTGGSRGNIYHLRPDWIMFLSLAKCDYTQKILKKYFSGENDNICYLIFLYLMLFLEPVDVQN